MMLPLYQWLGMNKQILASSASMAVGVNFLPWMGPMIGSAASLRIPVASIFNPLDLVEMPIIVARAGSWNGTDNSRVEYRIYFKDRAAQCLLAIHCERKGE
jgi:Mg2+/citrate symporter